MTHLPIEAIDLFSGIGGITLALHGIVTPVAYCDVWDISRRVLTKAIQVAEIPKAPICHDVHELNKTWLQTHNPSACPKMVVGGFPCVGFSPHGKQLGFKEKQSNLFYEMLRVVDDFQIEYVFMENVPGILRLGMHSVVSEFATRGFDLRWGVFPANAVGAPHERKRWFCLAVKKGTATQFNVRNMPAYNAFTWDPTNEPPRMTLELSKEREERCQMLGNSVVPDCVRYAFLYLVQGMHQQRLSTLSPVTVELEAVHPSMKKVANVQKRWPVYGTLESTIVSEIKRPLTAIPPEAALIFDPTAFVTTKEVSPLSKGAFLTQNYNAYRWATPRKSIVSACNFLTPRSVRDLPTQVRFEAGTPEELRHGQIAAEFVEYLMGFPLGFTKATSASGAQVQ